MKYTLSEIKNKLLEYYLNCGTKKEYENTKKFLKKATRKEILELCKDCALFDN